MFVGISFFKEDRIARHFYDTVCTAVYICTVLQAYNKYPYPTQLYPGQKIYLREVEVQIFQSTMRTFLLLSVFSLIASAFSLVQPRYVGIRKSLACTSRPLGRISVIRRLADEEEIAAAEVEASTKSEKRVTYVDGLTGETVEPKWVDASAGLVSPFQLDW